MKAGDCLIISAVQRGKNNGEAGTGLSTSVVNWVNSSELLGLNPGSESFWG